MSDFGKNDEAKKRGLEFEELVGDYYNERGYSVIRNGRIASQTSRGKYSNTDKGIGVTDNGVDIIAFNDKEILLIQCKDYHCEKYPIGKDALADILNGFDIFVEKKIYFLIKNLR